MKGKEKSMQFNNNFTRLNEMQDALIGSRKEILPSKYWIILNQKNFSQLKESGYENFKRTVALNYFTWIIDFKFWKDDQLKYLYFNLPLIATIKNIFRAIRAIFLNSCDYLSLFQLLSYNFITYMLWDFVSRNDHEHILDKLEEPIEGNPPRLYLNKKVISQDLANSFLEYNSIKSKIKINEIHSIMELGSGYGRTAFVFLKLIPNLKYLIVDIPPALYIAEKYLSNQFKDKKIFKFRKFNNFNEVKNEFEQADIAFFIPNQLELLPPKIADLFINISSLHEMRLDQIKFYFNCIDNLIKKYIYLKQWKLSIIPYENIIITEKDYPIRKNWVKIFWRKCKVKTKFFEALFSIKFK